VAQVTLSRIGAVRLAIAGVIRCADTGIFHPVCILYHSQFPGKVIHRRPSVTTDTKRGDGDG
jgi:hypothetical protein